MSDYQPDVMMLEPAEKAITLRIHLYSGTFIDLLVSDWKCEKDSDTGRFASLTWKMHSKAAFSLRTIDLTRIEAILELVHEGTPNEQG